MTEKASSNYSSQALASLSPDSFYVLLCGTGSQLDILPQSHRDVCAVLPPSSAKYLLRVDAHMMLKSALSHGSLSVTVMLAHVD